jgi:hypothetical protein
MTTMKHALLKAGLQPSPALKLEGFMKSFRYLVKKERFTESDALRVKILMFSQRNKLQTPSEVIVRS